MPKDDGVFFKRFPIINGGVNVDLEANNKERTADTINEETAITRSLFLHQLTVSAVFCTYLMAISNSLGPWSVMVISMGLLSDISTGFSGVCVSGILLRKTETR